MADDPANQKQFAEDVAALAAAGSGDHLGDIGGDYKMPSVDEVWKLIEQMEGISDEEKANLKENLYNPQEGTAEDFMRRYAQPGPVHSSWDYTIFFAMIAVIVLVFALFGYKLYKSLMEKELKRQEKQKTKQAKKSKKTN
ncbi:PREDICTED: uncharacterized protein LOC108368473 [Rhagoletis zephyria]|uniref:uncharacterized protein LOC108368473 n=1 Tax=Rhagoletis zephyria TaxID=28612 RepID=UPI00081135CD|nr:PREDICTED: uncharacterized protein LOC108368473 [Rhagoletis zephyria]XP_036330420.1 uncharacterized protein LOC118742451 isoform X1 [Rhagoletis pomonella]XP_036330421.1 uncharacterized protein LOC118742451 isoform X1 [Rhagoletis pomonella]XP_036330422.1 uncharacterized protein LOC118742451 isoform X1 [Rhagoletis pomonella]XP_036342380.1 uncharacterized protein LOC118751676 isoform X1 [Rhagoletis pomonella]XP_036342381.1 uncharacterized protein LOC118751676 isoform X1 [Rhagoletis pomonella]